MKGYYKKNVLGKVIVGLIILVVLAVTVVVVYQKKGKKKGEEMIGVYVVDKAVMAGDEVYGTLRMQQIDKSYAEILPDNVIVGEGKEMYYKINLNKGVILTEDMVRTDMDMGKDIRLHNFSYVELNHMISKGDYVDIRINFNDGSDYIVLSKKRVEGISVYNLEEGIDNELWINVSEEEILRMSSAAYDCATKENCRLYAVKYISELQEEAYVTYPVNQIVAALIESDPNIIEKVTQELEENLREQIDGLSDGELHNQSGESSKNEAGNGGNGSESPDEDDTLLNDEQFPDPDDDDSLVHDIEDDKEIQFLD